MSVSHPALPCFIHKAWLLFKAWPLPFSICRSLFQTFCITSAQENFAGSQITLVISDGGTGKHCRQSHVWESSPLSGCFPLHELPQACGPHGGLCRVPLPLCSWLSPHHCPQEFCCQHQVNSFTAYLPSIYFVPPWPSARNREGLRRAS